MDHSVLLLKLICCPFLCITLYVTLCLQLVFELTVTFVQLFTACFRFDSLLDMFVIYAVYSNVGIRRKPVC